MKKEIVISRMFTGKYLNYNLGHEAINIFKDDEGDHYIYLNDIGTFGKEHLKNGKLTIDKILLVKTIGGGAVEVVALASELSMIYNPEESILENRSRIERDYGHKIKYGGSSLMKLYDGSAQQDVLVTFKAEKVLTPKKRICIKYAPKNEKEPFDNDSFNDYEKILPLLETKMGQQLKNYVAEGSKDYKILQDITEDDSLWGDTLQKVDPKGMAGDVLPITYIDICGSSYDENIYSNTIAYYMRKYPRLVYDWVQNSSKNRPFYPGIGFSSKWTENTKLRIVREWAGETDSKKGRVDILLDGGSFVCAIENKLLSTLSSIEPDGNGQVKGSQLDKYSQMLDKYYNGVRHFVLLLLPDYHPLLHHLDKKPWLRPAIDGADAPQNDYTATLSGYPVVTYGQLLTFLEPYTKKDPYNEDYNFIQFVDSLRRHARKTDDGQYLDMMRQFNEIINTQQ
ncbi:MAG: PD-(D/E)XK nuclease family protein [Bacteroidales bacterium]|nr:PD-(D/E)XK nuclease family protein [Bacteroidales bacterium]